MTVAIVLLSGGIDSAVCFQKALRQGYDEVVAVHVDYGQQTEEIERRNAQRQAGEAGIELVVVDMEQPFSLFGEGTVEDKEYDAEREEQDGHSVGYVPQRNGQLIHLGTAIGEHRAEVGEPVAVYHGAQMGDEETYPDCRPEYMDRLIGALNFATDQHTIELHTPLIWKEKGEIIEEADRLGVELKYTFSCYNDVNGEPCGECPACIERLEAFEEADVEDPL